MFWDGILKQPFVLVQMLFSSSFSFSLHQRFIICMARVIWLSIQGIISPKLFKIITCGLNNNFKNFSFMGKASTSSIIMKSALTYYIMFSHISTICFKISLVVCTYGWFLIEFFIEIVVYSHSIIINTSRSHVFFTFCKTTV